MSDALVNGLAGASGGMIAQIITYPLQAVNTRQQTERKRRERTTQENKNASGGLSGGTLSALIAVSKREGLSGLYRGLPPSLLGTASSQGIYYYFYQLFQDIARQNLAVNGSLNTATNLMVAAFAGSLNVLLTNPIWIIVTRMQTQAQKLKSEPSDVEANQPSQEKKKYVKSSPTTSGTIGTVQEIYLESGISGFWKGVLPNLMMVCNPAIQFAIYEGLMTRLTAKRPKKKGGIKSASAIEIFFLGALAKLGATVMTYPLLVVKSRVQASQDIAKDERLKYKGTLDAIVKMIRYEGLGSFYRGLSTKITQSVLAASILFLMKEEMLKFVQALIERQRKFKSVAIIKTLS